jgi:hypothetical protein
MKTAIAWIVVILLSVSAGAQTESVDPYRS